MIFAKPISKKWKTFSIFRIIGNELPPRDEPGSRKKVLDFILDNEPNFPDAAKCWIVNCVHDGKRREEICRTLAERDMYYIVIPFWKEKFKEAKTRAEKIVQLIGINRARNQAITAGHLISDFTLVLDGDCYFRQDLWDTFTKGVIKDQKINRSRRYYSLPCSRSTIEHAINNSTPMMLAEPMPVFRYDSTIYFDESIPFGQKDKLMLMYKLHHSQTPGSHHILEREDLCKSISMVHHLTGSKYEIELDTGLRIRLREESLDCLLKQVEGC
jgi:hypothetical protein